jgi:flavin reductase (DIM6/NTAB) family NADH-FMN oxidoreductase RutF
MVVGMAEDPTTSEYRTGSDPRTLRDALGCFATGVTVVTCFDAEGCPFGITANSFTSVSLDPPLLLVNVHKLAACAPALTAASHFAINVLQTGQQPASITFSTRVEDRFGDTPWSCGEAGAPILKDSLSVFECERFAVYDGGDHHILVGQVVKASFDASLDPLLSFRGRYRRLHFD